MIPIADKSVGYLFSIEKGGLGSGIRGHITVREVEGKEELPKFESLYLAQVVKQIDKWMEEHVDNWAKLKDGIGTYENKIVWQLKDGRYVIVKGDLEARKPIQWIEEVPTYTPYKLPPKTAYEMSSQRNALRDGF